MNISKLTLGTAQLGSHYGIANTKGKPNTEEALQILGAAVERGINSFDTAQVYGNSEEIIGSFISSNPAVEAPLVISKLPKIEENQNSDFESVYKLVKAHIAGSLKRLKISKFLIYMLHDAFNIDSHNGNIVKSLVRIKKEGLIERIGVSIYYPKEALRTMPMDEIEALQLPINLFDLRFLKGGLLAKLAKKKIIFIRSIFLQGLFFLNPNNLPLRMRSSVLYLNRLKEISMDENIAIDELAIGFVKDLAGVKSIVVGAETPQQVQKNAQLFQTSRIDNQLRNRIMDSFCDVPLETIIPSFWS